MKCPNCGEDNPDEMKFCGNCGTKLPEKKNFCPNCNKEWPLTMKFCGECGFKFGIEGTKNAAGVNGGLSMGDKNVIAGDVMGKKDETNISGNATIIKNEDETKKTARCHVCGSIVLRIEGYDCPVCGQFTCKDCYVPEAAMCKTCRNSSGTQKEDVYKQAVKRVLEDGKIDMTERQELLSLQQQLGLNTTRALELENIVKSEMSSKNISQIGNFDRISLEKAKTILYDELKFNEAIRLLEPLCMKYSNNEEILADYLFALSKVDPQMAKNVINSIHADVLCSYLTMIDIATQTGDYSQVEEYISKAEKLWGDEILLKCRKAELYIKLAEVSGDSNYMYSASKMMETCAEPKNKLERTWVLKVNRTLYQLFNKALPKIKELDYSVQDVYKGFFIENITDEMLENLSLDELLVLEKRTNDAKVQKNIGLRMRLSNDFFPVNSKDSIEWFTKAAEQGDAEAQRLLGFGYRDSNGVAQDYNKAVAWFTKAAEQGDKPAKQALDDIYKKGVVIPQDSKQKQDFHDFYDLFGNSSVFMEIFSDLEKKSSKNKTKPQSVSLIDSLTEKAEHGDAEAQYKLGDCYLCGALYGGQRFMKDTSKAIEFLTKAAESGHAQAQADLAEIYYSGDYVKEDYEESAKWAIQSSEQGNPDGQYILGLLYMIGEGVQQDDNKAKELLQKAAEQGIEAAKDALDDYDDYNE